MIRCSTASGYCDQSGIVRGATWLSLDLWPNGNRFNSA